MKTLDIDAVLGAPAEVFEEWRALFDAEPWGEERQEWLHGIQLAIQTGKPPTTFMPFVEPPKREPQTAEEQIAIIGMIPGVVWTKL